MSNFELTNIEDLWSWACSGNVEKLREFYASGGNVNNRYFGFGESHSLIMGAFRNNQFDTVEYLMSVGEELTQKEYDEIQTEMRKRDIMQQLIGRKEQNFDMINGQSM